MRTLVSVCMTREGSRPRPRWAEAADWSRIRDELLSQELFETLAEAKVLIEDWRTDYNTNRPHSALGMMAPARFAASRRRSGSISPRLSLVVDR